VILIIGNHSKRLKRPNSREKLFVAILVTKSWAWDVERFAFIEGITSLNGVVGLKNKLSQDLRRQRQQSKVEG